MKIIQKDLSGINTPEELFEKWREAHAQEAKPNGKGWDNSRESTFPDRECFNGEAHDRQVKGYAKDFCTSFCCDGFLVSPTEGEKGKTILFICREANLTARNDDSHISEDGKLMPAQPGDDVENFWMKCEYSSWKEKEHSSENRSKNVYIKFISKITEWCASEDGCDPGEYALAYMNLNKRGGFGECNTTRIKHYTEMYQVFIRREIEIIAPDIIICGGTYDTVVKYFPEWKKKCRNYWHPSRGVHEKK